ncbi:MAG: hypothetical protein H7Y27_08930, partial [Gemmatimonadaceae bacterium]|nr:hypothetical protein [Chitinophagaceae bacterium]
MRNLTFILLFSAFAVAGLPVNAQKLTASAKKVFVRHEDSLKAVADSMINGETAGKRFRSDSLFVRMLVRALKNKNSFNYTFDSLPTISRLYAPDSTFRIFTWQMKKDDYMYLQKGAIQMRTQDGSLKLIPLTDQSMFTAKPQDSIRTRVNWIGAIYYKIIQKTFNGKNYYTLLGYDDYSVGSNRKWMDVLSFNENGEPLFG